MQYETDFIDFTGTLGLHWWMLALSVGHFLRMEKYDVNPSLFLPALVRAYEIYFVVAEQPSWFSYNFEDSLLSDVVAFAELGRFAILHHAVSIRY